MLVISGPSGSGKSSICRQLLEDDRVVFSISATTRPMRTGEVHGRDYYFVPKDRFRQHIEAGEFIEWAEVHGNLYGTLRQPMEDALAAGKIYLVEIDVQGGKQLKELGLPGLYVFISPPSMDDLRSRLEGRGTDEPEVIERRLQKAEDEMRARDRYDHVIVNHELESAVEQVRALVCLVDSQD
ncbi:MAG: guanylate kinase [Planctomycetota bacterium]|jgi:guanylate kinase